MLLLPSPVATTRSSWTAENSQPVISQVGGSLWDVQELARHTSLAMTQRYIEGDTEGKRKLVALL